MATPNHRISIIVGGNQIEGFTTYRITSSMTKPASPFSLSIPFSRKVWDLCNVDRTIQVLIDDVVILNGFIDSRDLPADGEEIAIAGRDRTGRLVNDSAPGVNFKGLGIRDVVAKLADPFFPAVSFTNDRNRRILRGRGGKKPKGHRRRTGPGFVGKVRTLRGEDSALRLNTRVGTQIEPGQTRWQVISTLAAQAGYLVWSSGDGEELIVGAPDYDQETQFVFFMPREGSTSPDATCLGFGVHDDAGDRYSRVIVVGAGTGTDENYGAPVSARYAEARNNDSDPEGAGLDFTEPKRLIISRSVQSADEAQEIADREMARRDAAGHTLAVRAAGHGQIYSGSTPTLFACDTLALTQDERTGTGGIYLITECVYQSGRSGEETLMTLVKSGSELTEV